MKHTLKFECVAEASSAIKISTKGIIQLNKADSPTRLTRITVPGLDYARFEIGADCLIHGQMPDCPQFWILNSKFGLLNGNSLTPGYMLLAAPFAQTCVRAYSGAESLRIELAESQLHAAADRLGHLREFERCFRQRLTSAQFGKVQMTSSSAKFVTQCCSLLEMTQGNTFPSEFSKGLVEEIAHQLVFMSGSEEPWGWRRSYYRLRRILERIHTDYRELSDLAAICSQYGLSERTLQRYFEEHLQISPMAYVQALRLSHARTLLRSDIDQKLRITDVAMVVGMPHLSHFASAYQKIFGELPTQTHIPERREP